MTGYCNCLISANCLIALSDYNFTELLAKNKVANVPFVLASNAEPTTKTTTLN